MQFIGEQITSRGVAERPFRVEGAVGDIPGILWTPEGASGPRPLVLVGHGGSGDKRMPYVLSLARRLVRHQGWAVAAIDGVGHGERSGPSVTAGAREEGLPRSFVEQVAAAADQMTADWTATLAELRGLDEVGRGSLGYWGLSMGTMFGLPFVAATPEVQVAVLGLMGTFADTNPWGTAAASVTCPVLFLIQLHDELVPTHRALSLFESIASTDKRLHAHPGAHSAVPPEEMDASEAFLALHLR